MAMIYKKKHDEEIPEDAVRLSEYQALAYQKKIIDKWEKISEVYMLKAGPGILGGVGMISSIVINNHFRTKLKLGQYGRMSSYLSVVAIPAMFSALFHTTLIQSYVILKLYDCPICLQTRAALIQAGAGVVYPFLLAPAAAFMFATRHFTYRLPSVTTQKKEIFALWLKFTKSANMMGVSLIALNMFAAMYVTSKQMQQHALLNLKLSEYEKKIDSGYLPADDEM